MTLQEKVDYLVKNIDKLSGYMVGIVQNAAECIRTGRIGSIGYNTTRFIDRACNNIRYGRK